MKKLGIALVALVTLLIVASMAATMFISSDGVLNTVTENVEKSTGRTFSINGEHQLSVFPSLKVELNDVRFANAEHGTEPYMASMSRLSLHIPWTSVFTGNFVIEKFVIDELQLTLEKSASGAGNWEMGPSGSRPQAGRAGSDESQQGAKRSRFPDSFDVSLGQVEIRSGSFTFIDHQKDTVERVSNLSLAIELPSLRQPLQIDGSLNYKNQTLNLRTILDNPIKLINGDTFATDLSLDSQLLTLQYDGEVQQTPLNVTGKLSASGESVKDILAWQGQPLEAKDDAFNGFSLEASIGLTESQFDLKEMNFFLDALDIKGQSNITFTATPKVNAEINLGDLNLNPYLPEVAEVPPEENAEKVPVVWDDTQMDLSGLSAVNLNLKVTSNSLQAREIKLGKNQLSLKLNSGVLELGLDEFNAYSGSGTGKLILNSARKPYQINTNFQLQGIDFQPLLTDVAKFDKLMGKGQVNWQLNTQGLSQRDFVSALGGNLNFEVKDGAVRGVNIAALAESAENVMTGNLAAVNLDKDFNNAEKTDFASLTGNLNFKQGVMNTNDILLLNPFVRVSVTGAVNLPATNVDLKASTKLVASSQGQGGDAQASGVNIPIKITGPFHDVKIKPDLESLIKDKFEDKVKDKLKGLFGG